MSKEQIIGDVVGAALPERATSSPATVWSNEDIGGIKRKLDAIMRHGNNTDNPGERFYFPPVCLSWQWKREFAGQFNAIVGWIIGDVHPKGLWLAGNPGTGKSTLMRAVKNLCAVYSDPYSPNLPRHMVWRHAKDISSGYEEDGAGYLTDLCEVETLVIDDLGTEPTETMRFGNVRNVVEEVLSRRYDRGLMTMVTTNLTMEQVRKVYRDRIYDRIRETFEVLEFRGRSHRERFNPNI